MPPVKKTARRRVFEVVNATEPGDKLGVGVDYFLIGLILVNILALLLETVEQIHSKAPKAFYWFEVVSVAIFTTEYVLRFWSAPEAPRFVSRWNFVKRPLALIDLLAIIPFYLPFLGIDLRSFRILRTFRLLRLVKLLRYMRALDLILAAIKSKKHELIAANGLVVVVIMMLATVMYFIEHKAQPEAFSNAFQGMWWGVATLSTVGYGDIYPITVMGKFVTSIASILMIGLVALPTSILTSAILEGQEKHRNKFKPPSVFCPYCQGDGHIDEGDPGFTEG